eukprot:GILJ01006591.1.p1 GENE.GILJ01006591.1~~GILJ01006591.1.p1  ORF type:complete len:294 (+),score=12.94 GILJ01006591.1:100-981(+)
MNTKDVVAPDCWRPSQAVPFSSFPQVDPTCPTLVPNASPACLFPVGVHANSKLNLGLGREPLCRREPRMPLMRWCHHCRANKMGTQCCNSSVQGRSGIRPCRKVFCRSCLQRTYGESLDDALKDFNWWCPYCRSTCVCTHCRPSEEAGKRRDSPSTTGFSSSLPQPALDVKTQRRLAVSLSRVREMIKQVTAELRVAFTGCSWVLEVVDQDLKGVLQVCDSFDSLARRRSPRSSGSAGDTGIHSAVTSTPSVSDDNAASSFASLLNSPDSKWLVYDESLGTGDVHPTEKHLYQ